MLPVILHLFNQPSREKMNVDPLALVVLCMMTETVMLLVTLDSLPQPFLVRLIVTSPALTLPTTCMMMVLLDHVLPLVSLPVPKLILLKKMFMDSMSVLSHVEQTTYTGTALALQLVMLFIPNSLMEMERNIVSGAVPLVNTCIGMETVGLLVMNHWKQQPS